ncbi:hypothetical protein QTQ03_03670 [Micromonospora sp. WMMA1363]|uniref:hypothetical protein n=1 Tax=Micromonospora sp. WMMA1363 TaxID=3053985 RepID=UPI00259C7640|nr:hypothetical protein [Micromonospora sp. WMMA1363]MDM4718734.1 hypothetical protein [Micromonospora sp. WMMA1363]
MQRSARGAYELPGRTAARHRPVSRVVPLAGAGTDGPVQQVGTRGEIQTAGRLVSASWAGAERVPPGCERSAPGSPGRARHLVRPVW